MAHIQKKYTLENVSSSSLAQGLLSSAIIAVAVKKFNKPSCEAGPGVTVEFASSASTIAENAGSSARRVVRTDSTRIRGVTSIQSKPAGPSTAV